MLRNAVLAIGLVWLAGGVVLAVATGGWPIALPPAIIVAGILFERHRYAGNATGAAPADWRRTGERFLDEASGRPVTVWFNSTTGERRYEEE